MTEDSDPKVTSEPQNTVAARRIEYPNFSDAGRPVWIGAKEVPGLRAYVDREGLPTSLVLDSRLALDLPRDPHVAEAIVAFVADAIAYGRGFPSFAAYDPWPPSGRR